MGNYRKLLSLMICAVLCIGMVVPAFAADVAAAPVKGGDPLAGIDASNYNVWRYESADTLNGVSATINAYVTRDGVRTTEMKYTADPNYGVKCAATVYEPVGGALGLGDHRITTAFVGANKLIVDCSYVAVTYLTECGDKHGLVFRNTGGAGSVTLTDDTSVSGGKWVTVYAPITDANKTNIITRMNKSFGNMGLVWDGASDANETLYVREIVFFKNESDAKAYAAASPVCYNGDAYVAPKDEPKTEDKPSVEVAVPVEVIQDGNKLIYDSYDPFTVLDPKSYIVWRYESAETLNSASATINTYVPKNGTPTKEMQYTVDPKFGVKCAATVSEPVGGALGLGNHRITTCFVGANKLTVDLNYVAVTYLTKSNEQYGLVFRNTGGAGSVTLTNDTSASHGKWTTVYVPITGSEKTNIITRMNKSFGNMGLMWQGAKKATETLYVREIVFFENEADAALYAEVAPAFYMNEQVVKKLPKTEEQQLKLNLMASVISAMRGAKWAVEDEKKTTLPTEWIEYVALFDMRSAAALDKTSATHADSGVVTYITEKNEEAAKLEFTPGTSTYGYYRIAFTPDAVDGIDIDSGDYYAAVTYRADTEAALTLTAGTDTLTLTDKTAVSAKWQTTSVKIDAESDILKALADGNDEIALSWGQDAPNGTVEIKELVFFLHESRMEDYEKYAPIYYNSFYDFIPSNPLDSIKNEIKFDFSNRSALSGMLMLKDTDATIVANKQTSTLVNEKIDGIEATKIDGLAEGASNIHRLPFWSGPAAKNAFAANENGTFYTAITYMTDGEGSLVLHHGGNGTEGVGAVTYCNTVPSDKWQTAVYSGTVGSKLMERLRDEYNIVVLAWNNTEADKNIYIKEIVFFTNKADAEKYGEDAARYYNYKAGYEKIDAPQTAVPTDPLSGIARYDKWTFASADTLAADGATLDRTNMADTSLFTKDPNFGVRALKVKYLAKTGVNTYWAQVKHGNLAVTPNFVAVTYLTTDTADADIDYLTFGKGNGSLLEDTSSSNGRWTTGYKQLTDADRTSIVNRLTQNGSIAITWTNTDQDSEIYIREIVFFENEADAAAYTAKAPIYYNYAEDYSWQKAPLSGLGRYDKWTFASADTLAADGAALDRTNMATTSVFTSDPMYGVCCLKAKYLAKTGVNTYWAQVKHGNLAVTPNYVAITYLTNDTANANFDYITFGKGNGSLLEGTSSSNGRWTTGYKQLTDADRTSIVNRLTQNGSIVIAWTNTAQDSEIYIREIVFFEKEADVKAYAKQAPIYYNYYSK